MKKINIFLIIMLLWSFVFNCYAEDKSMDEWSLYVNGALIESEDNVKYNECVLLPLRTIFEALGATIEWQQETGETIICYKDEVFLCYTEKSNSIYYFFIQKKDKDEFIYLNPMATLGGFYMINDRMYIFEESGVRLFEAMGCSVEIDEASKTVKINSIASDIDTKHWGIAKASHHIKNFKFIKYDMDMSDIYKVVGEPEDYVGSGIWWDIYRLRDGNYLHLNDHMTGKLKVVILETEDDRKIPLEFNEDGTLNVEIPINKWQEISDDINISKELALKIADTVFEEKFGKDFIEKTQVTIEEIYGVYKVYRCPEVSTLGGDGTVVISKKDGHIMSVIAGE
ncbi:MAG: copper amine oxidase N-terminal domain-containing protein [Ruminococcaceae bacterium]|nr:copper amine oxidase N-terminal domain-containing protein [Oscillospiraceae bacterium]